VKLHAKVMWVDWRQKAKNA